MNDENACEQAVHQFSESTTGAMLLLTHPTKKMPVPPALKEISIGCCIYWGYRSPSNPGTVVFSQIFDPGLINLIKSNISYSNQSYIGAFMPSDFRYNDKSATRQIFRKTKVD